MSNSNTPKRVPINIICLYFLVILRAIAPAILPTKPKVLQKTEIRDASDPSKPKAPIKRAIEVK